MAQLRARAGIILMLVAAMAVSACGRGDRPAPLLMNIGNNDDGTPDEFGILPNKPIEVPKDLAELPEPTPGGTNRVDPTPEADAVAALGGNLKYANRETIPASDGGVVTYASRFGVSGDIRKSLAADDIEWRRRHNGRVLERLFNINTYYKAYRKMSLNQYLELERLRRRGVRTVAAPPDGAQAK